MFRNLRSRRRPRYGSYFCAVSAAILLLFSVTLLHTRLNSTHHLPNHHAPPFDDLLSTANPLLDDSSDPVSSSKSDDRIDITDDDDNDQTRVLNEDELLRSVDDSEDDDADSQSARVSGYFFDHQTGAIRRAFDKRSIDQWEDYVGFDVVLGDDTDLSTKGVFGSDDVPVDEDVRRKAGEVNGVEDALLLKIGKKVSPLREGWGAWFDAKGDFLRRDRMFKSNLELLNPLNNPMLQDPDGVGVTGLSRGDKLVQKGWFNQYNKVPFPLPRLESTRESKSDDGDQAVMMKKENVLVSDDEVGKNEIKKASRRTLDDKASTKLDTKKNVKRDDTIKNVDSSSSFNEFSGQLYADGKRWGYFPGLDPHLSFSKFMNAFLRKGRCSIRVFMVWNYPPWMFTVRHHRALESIFLQHRDACVIVFSETIELNFFKDFLEDGFKVGVVMPNLDELLKDTPTHVFASVWFEWRKTKLYSTHYSELVRLAALYKYGGIYLDSDILLLKPLSGLNNSVGMEDYVAGSSLNGAVMAFRKHSPFVKECLKEFYSTYDDSRLRWNGADLLTRVLKKREGEKSNPNKNLELNVQPSFIFFPIGPHNITRYFIAPTTDIEKSEEDDMLRKILDRSVTFHLWNRLTSALVPEPESLVARIINHHCILRCSGVL